MGAALYTRRGAYAVFHRTTLALAREMLNAASPSEHFQDTM
jgi:hypothetical protein